MKLDAKSDPAPGPRRELKAAALLALVFCLVNFLVATRTPTVSLDEPQYCDPAANLYLGSDFTSTMWGQHRDAFWCGNVPLYQGILYCIFKLAGFGLFQARIVNTFLAAAAALLIWAALRRTNLVGTPAHRLLCVCLILSGSVSTLTFRTIRPDTTMFFACALVYYAGSLPRVWQRCILTFFCSALLPFAGVPMLPYAAMMLFLNVAVYGFINLVRLASIGFGVVAGIGGLVVFYNHFSSWHTFLEIVLPFTGIGGAAPSLHYRIFGDSLGAENIFTSFFGNPLRFLDQKTLFDYSAAVLFLTAAVLAKKSWRTAAEADRKLMAFILVAALAVPPFMHMAGHYRSMYRWMTYIPLAVAVAVPRFLEIHRATGGALATRLAASAAIGFSLCIGLPFRTVAAIPGWRERSIAPLEQVAARVVRPSDVVVCEFKAYFALRPRSKLLYGNGLAARGEFSRTTDLPTNDITLLCLRPESFLVITRTVGGTWKKIDLSAVQGSEDLAQTRYAMDFYRRAPENARSAGPLNSSPP